MMNVKQAMTELKKMGTAQNVKVYTRHGVNTEMFGVSYANMGALTKRIKQDHKLAIELWKTDIHDARVLATMIADPEQLNKKTLNAWVKHLKNYVLTDAFSKMVAQSELAIGQFEEWIDSRKEFTAAAGWTLLCCIADNESIPDAFFKPWIKKIEKGIHSAPNRTRHSMNQALIGIGIRNDSMQKLATAAAKRIGVVDVDHGETSCKTPDAAAYIAKTRSYRKGKASKAKNGAKKKAAKKKVKSVAKKASKKKASKKKASKKKASKK